MKYAWKILFILCLIIQFNPSFAENDAIQKVDPFPSTQPGQYAFYHDTRDGVHHVSTSSKMDRLIGIVKINSETYVVRVYDLQTGSDFTFHGYFTKEKGIYNYVCEGFNGDANTGMIIMADLMNLLNYYSSEIDKVNKKLTDKPVKITTHWEGYDSWNENSYDWWLPFFKLSSSKYASKNARGKKGAVSLKLLFLGRFTADTQMNFFKYKSIPGTLSETPDSDKYKLAETNADPVKMEGVTLNIDSNWEYMPKDKESGIFFDTYWIKKFSTRDALIGVEVYNVKSVGNEKALSKLQMRGLALNECIIVDSIKIDKKNKTLSFLIWDVENDLTTIHVSRSLGIKNHILKNINFSAFEVIYNQNKAYFNSIINGAN